MCKIKELGKRIMSCKLLSIMLGCLLLMVQTGCAVLRFDNSYYSRRNRERPIRKSTSVIVLHTTEAPSKSALRKLRDLGEANYCIAENGRVYRIIDHRRVAYHAGRSMWWGRRNVDSFSVGIEVCGYHNKMITDAQFRSLADLIGEMQNIYHIPDHRVISHSHVAYGAPNKWHRRSHRGRKRCGMMFALPSVRRRLHLSSRPTYDPDVRAGRLVVGDPYLASVLYGRARVNLSSKGNLPAESNIVSAKRSAWDIARDRYDKSTTVYQFPDGKKLKGNEIKDFGFIPRGTKVLVNAGDASENASDSYKLIGKNGRAQDIAGDEMLASTTIYIYPNGRFSTGKQLTLKKLLKLPYGTKVLVGYFSGGPITAKRSATIFCGSRWKSSDTYFLIKDRLVPGNQVDDSKIPAGTYVFYKD